MSASQSDDLISWAAEAARNGVPSITAAFTDGDAFGDSGDVFDHISWRNFIMHCYHSARFCSEVVKLCNQLMLRGRQLKIQYRGKILSYSINFEGVDSTVLKKYNILGGSSQIPIQFATESSRITAKTLTPERFKCVARPIIVVEMMRMKRVPATSAAVGFETLVQDYQGYKYVVDLIEKRNKEVPAAALIFSESRNPEKDAYKFIIQDPESERFLQMSDETIDVWGSFLGEANTIETSTAWLNVAGMYSAAVSQKEIYQECEDMFPGTIFWAGVHCMMTDTSNKKRAGLVPVDQQQRFLNSNFYGDFKKKQNARGLMVTKTETYINLLSACIQVMAHYTRTGSNLSAGEVGVMDRLTMIMRQKLGEASSSVKASSSGMVSSDPAAVEAAFTLKSAQLVAGTRAYFAELESKGSASDAEETPK